MLYGLHVQEAALGEQPRWNYNAMNIGLSASDMSKRLQIVKTATRLENLETIQTITCSALLLVGADIWQSCPPTKWTSIYSLKASICRNSNIRAGDAEFVRRSGSWSSFGRGEQRVQKLVFIQCFGCFGRLEDRVPSRRLLSGSQGSVPSERPMGRRQRTWQFRQFI